MPGSYLRTNYRSTGGELDIIGIGGGILLASNAGGAGTKRAFGGFILVSLPVSASAIMDASAAVTANRSGCYTLSTYALLSLYYGTAEATVGCKAFPLWVAAISSHLSVGSVTVGGGLIQWMPVAPSGSILNIKLRVLSVAAESAAGGTGSVTKLDWQSMGGSQPNVMAAFFIASAP